jgi:hypothetical protein
VHSRSSSPPVRTARRRDPQDKAKNTRDRTQQDGEKANNAEQQQAAAPEEHHGLAEHHRRALLCRGHHCPAVDAVVVLQARVRAARGTPPHDRRQLRPALRAELIQWLNARMAMHTDGTPWLVRPRRDRKSVV